MSLIEGVFPNINKAADVRPSYKKGDRTRCENYQPISLLSNVSKIFERIMYSRLEDFLKSTDVLYKFQFGFRKQYPRIMLYLALWKKTEVHSIKICIAAEYFLIWKKPSIQLIIEFYYLSYVIMALG